MEFIKKYFKLFIGCCVIILAVIVFFFAQRTGSLESANLDSWAKASVDRRIAAVKILTASDTDTEVIVQCVDKIADVQDSEKMAVKDAVSLCFTGLQLKENV